MLALDILAAAFARSEQHLASGLSDQQQKATLLQPVIALLNRTAGTEETRCILSPDLDAVISAWARHTFGEL